MCQVLTSILSYLLGERRRKKRGPKSIYKTYNNKSCSIVGRTPNDLTTGISEPIVDFSVKTALIRVTNNLYLL